MENIKVIRENLKIAHDRQKSYVDNRCRALEFKFGEAFLKLSPLKRVIKLVRKETLKP